MGLTAEKKDWLNLYLLQKIDDGDPSAVRKTADAFGLTPASVHRHLNRLEEQNVVRKIQRGRYELVDDVFTVTLHRSAGELSSEDAILDRYLSDHLKTLPDNVRRIWNYTASEMLNNIIEHSEAETLQLTLFRNPLNTCLILHDDGVGIFDKIRTFFSLDSVDDAVRELFKGKITTDAAHHSGEGIFFSSRMADTFLILSSGKLFTHDRLEADRLLDSAAIPGLQDSLASRGTTFFLKLANHSKKNAKEIFDEFADVDGGFLRTRILMRNYFESAPISRSQAKRLCAGLEQFEEIVLDFDGIDWMGQGFADQLFRIFQQEHPELRILPLNLCPDVRRMLRHVQG